MKTLLVYPENNKQLKAIKSVMMALNVRFEKKEESPYDPVFVEKIKRGDKDILNGNTRKISKDTTAYLMSSKVNFERLSQAIERAKKGETETHELIEI